MTRPTGPERGVRHIVLTAMSGPYTLPLLGASLLASVALGVHLGQSSISLINPIHFQGPAVHPRDRGVALDERALAMRRRTPPPVVYGWEEGYAARAADCGDCTALRLRDAGRHEGYSAVVPYFGGTSRPPRRVEPVEVAYIEPAKDLFDDVRPARRARERDIARYAHYRVEQPGDDRTETVEVAPYKANDVWLD